MQLGDTPEPIFITPTEAARLLEEADDANPRKYTPANADPIKYEMLRGKFIPYTTIYTDEDDRLVDGQHRLNAVVLAGRENPDFQGYWFSVLKKLPREQVRLLDRGAPRTPIQVGKYDGIPNAATAISAARIYLGISRKKAIGPQPQIKVPDTALYEVAKEGEMQSAAEWAEAHRDVFSPASAVAAAYYLLHQVHAKEADQFFHDLATGEMLHSPDAVLNLRDKILNHALKGKLGPRMIGQQTLYLIVRAWNMRIDGDIKQLRLWAKTVDPIWPKTPGAVTGDQPAISPIPLPPSD